jgi:hypothetical protein
MTAERGKGLMGYGLPKIAKAQYRRLSNELAKCFSRWVRASLD